MLGSSPLHTINSTAMSPFRKTEKTRTYKTEGTPVHHSLAHS